MNYTTMANVVMPTATTGNELLEFHRRVITYPNFRVSAIRWMKEILCLANVPPDARDTAIQIFDKFVAISTRAQLAALVDESLLSISATVSILLGLKFHDANTLLTMASFPQFEIPKLLSCECVILQTIKFDISPLASPCANCRRFLSMSCVPIAQHTAVFSHADELISLLWEDAASLLYAPCTVACAALMITFVTLSIECSDWVVQWTAMCMPFSFSDSGSVIHDIDGCMAVFETLNSAATVLPAPSSPSPSPSPSADAAAQARLTASPTSVESTMTVASTTPALESVAPLKGTILPTHIGTTSKPRPERSLDVAAIEHDAQR